MRDFLRELRRRRVVRALVVYLVVAWIVAQVSAITFPALRLPPWTVTFVVVLLALGIPVTMVLAWAYELTPQPSAGEIAQPAARPAVPARHHVTAAGLLGVLVAFAALGSWFAVMRPSREVGARAGGPLPFDRVAVLPFRGAGPGARGLAEGMMDLLSLNLGGVQGIRPIDPRAVLARWPADSAVDPARALEVAGQLGAGAAILGSVVSVGERLRIAADLYDVGSGELRSSAEVEGTEGDAAQLADRLAVELMKQLWSKGALPTIRVEALTTSDPKALRHYLTGERAYRRGEYALARDEFRKATELDSAFALAFYRGSISTEWAGPQELVVPLAAAAERHSDRLPERYRWLLAARRASHRGDVAEAERLYETVVSAYPDDVEAWFQLGEIRYHYGPLWGQPEALALQPFQRALDLDSAYPGAYLHLARVAAALGDSAALDEYTRKGLQVEA
ncbi:MAG: tetratricopeptide repeat protein, partial [Gemmatimonadetes bacterium]|nr:tetratricopeptide repeat protein [Gemmatimonadota bacterium]